MDFKKDIAIDGAEAVEGVWFKFGSDGAQVRVARLNNVKHIAASKKLGSGQRGIANRYRSEGSAALDKGFAGVVADTLLKDWKGFTMEGKEFAYTRENAMLVLLGEEYAEFTQFVLDCAADHSAFAKEDKVATLGKL